MSWLEGLQGIRKHLSLALTFASTSVLPCNYIPWLQVLEQVVVMWRRRRRHAAAFDYESNAFREDFCGMKVDVVWPSSRCVTREGVE